MHGLFFPIRTEHEVTWRFRELWRRNDKPQIALIAFSSVRQSLELLAKVFHLGGPLSVLMMLPLDAWMRGCKGPFALSVRGSP